MTAPKDLLDEYLDEDRIKREKILEEFRKDDDRLNECIRIISGMPEGQELIWWLLSMAGVFNSSFTGNSETFFREGARLIGLELIHRLAAVRPGCVEQMIKMGKVESA